MLRHPSVAMLLVVVALTASNAGGAPAAQNGTEPHAASEMVTAISSNKPKDASDTSTRTTTSTSTTTTAATTTTTTSEELFDFTSFKNTSTFTCDGKVTGYYADVKLECRVYHFCTQLDGLDGPSYQRMSYMCLEGSYFDQKDLNCVREADLKVTCNRAEAEYERSNKQFDPKEESQPSMSDNLAANIMMNPIARFIAGR